MDPDLDDPNNHVPLVSPEDGWDDLAEDLHKPAQGQHSERPDRGIPAKKEGRKRPIVHYAPKLKLHDNSSYSPVGSKPAAMSNQGDDMEAPERPSRKIAEITSSKVVVTAKDRTAKKKLPINTDNIVSHFHTANSEKVDDEGENKVVIPLSQANKRLRVNAIGPSREIGIQRISKMYPPQAITPVTPAEGVQRTGRTGTHFSRGERADWGEKTARGSLRWTAYSGISIVVLVIIAVVINRPKPGEGGREQSMFSQLAPAESEVVSEEGDGKMVAMLTVVQEEAKQIFAKYATAEKTADFIGMIHRHDEIADVVERQWEPLRAGKGWKPNEQSVWTVLELDDVSYGMLQGSLLDFTSYRAFFRHDGGDLKLDWKATVGYCSTDFVSLQKGEGDGGEVRAWLAPADFYTFPLPEGEFRSFRLASPDKQENLWGYTKVGGVLDEKLLAQFVPSQITGEALSEVAVVVVLERGPTEALPNQWIITNLLRLNWLDE